MKIKDFMDLDKLQSIQDQFSDATGLAVIIVDTEGNYVTRGSNFTDFCMKYTRGTEEGKRKCQQCDYESTGTYLCHAGLVDFSADIKVEGEKVGTVIGGQVLTREPDEEKFRQIAENLGINPDDYIRALHKVPVRTDKAIRAAAGLLADVMNQSVNLEYMRYRNSRRLNTFDTELENATKTVDVIYQKTRELDGIATKQNILSLNASIESARAGVAGAGFAVVAKQMGDLASQSAGIYKEISESAQQIKRSVEVLNGKYESEQKADRKNK